MNHNFAKPPLVIDTNVLISAMISPNSIIHEAISKALKCKDPKDNMFLELALSCNAEYLITGDKKDLITMNPFRKIQIITARQFLEKF